MSEKVEKVDLVNGKGVIIWPYAVVENGEIISRHKSYKAALKAVHPDLLTWKPAKVKKFIEFNAPLGA